MIVGFREGLSVAVVGISCFKVCLPDLVCVAVGLYSKDDSREPTDVEVVVDVDNLAVTATEPEPVRRFLPVKGSVIFGVIGSVV